jgi:hypothetical protein
MDIECISLAVLGEFRTAIPLRPRQSNEAKFSTALSEDPSSSARGAASSRTQPAIASAMVQRRMGGGAIATRLLYVRHHVRVFRFVMRPLEVSVMRGRHLTSDLAPYIACAAAVPSALDYCVQSFGTNLSAASHIGTQSETGQPMNIVDRSHKGDRLSVGQSNYGQGASGGVAIGNMKSLPANAPLVDAPRSPSLPPDLRDGCESALSSLTPSAVKNNIAGHCVT